MTVMALTPVRMINLVAPLPHEGTAQFILKTMPKKPGKFTLRPVQ